MESNKSKLVELETKFDDEAKRLEETITRMRPMQFEKRKPPRVVIEPDHRHNRGAKRWENHAFHYAKSEYGSEDFDKLLEQGYEQFGVLTKGNLALMRKPKAYSA